MIGIEALLDNIGGLTPLTVVLVALAGLVIGVAPSSFPLLAVAAGLGTGEGTVSTGKGWFEGFWLASGFALGIVTVDVILGAMFGFAGFAVLRILNSAMAYVYGLLAVVLALTRLALWRVVRVKIPVLRPSARPVGTFAGAYVLGLPFGLSICPACTPLLFPVVVAASSSADPLMGAVLMGSFGLARGVPIIVVGTMATSLGHLRHGDRFMRWAERVGGTLLIGASGYFLWQAARYAGWVV